MSTVKIQQSSSGHPKLNMLILGASSGLMTISAISGFISYGKLGRELSGTKKLLLGASLMSLLSAILLGVGIFLIHRHSKKMEHAFKGLISLTLLVLAGLFMLISGIMYAAAVVQMNKSDPNKDGKKYKYTYGTSFNTAILSAVMTLGGLGAVGTSFLLALLAMRKKGETIVPLEKTTVDLEPSYTDQDGATVQLQQLQLGTGVSGQTANLQQTGGI